MIDLNDDDNDGTGKDSLDFTMTTSVAPFHIQIFSEKCSATSVSIEMHV